MTDYKKLALAWTVPMAFTAATIISLMMLLSSDSAAQAVTLGFAGAFLMIGLLGWIHFRIEWMQLLKGKNVMTEEDIKFYKLNPEEHDIKFKARKRKILTFEIVMLICLATTLLVGLPTLM